MNAKIHKNHQMMSPKLFQKPMVCPILTGMSPVLFVTVAPEHRRAPEPVHLSMAEQFTTA